MGNVLSVLLIATAGITIVDGEVWQTLYNVELHGSAEKPDGVHVLCCRSTEMPGKAEAGKEEAGKEEAGKEEAGKEEAVKEEAEAEASRRRLKEEKDAKTQIDEAEEDADEAQEKVDKAKEEVQEAEEERDEAEEEVKETLSEFYRLDCVQSMKSDLKPCTIEENWVLADHQDDEKECKKLLSMPVSKETMFAGTECVVSNAHYKITGPTKEEVTFE